MNEYLEQVGANSVFHPLVEYLHCMLISNTVLLVHFQKWGLGENVLFLLFGGDSGSTRRTGKESEGRMEGGREGHTNLPKTSPTIRYLGEEGSHSVHS